MNHISKEDVGGRNLVTAVDPFVRTAGSHLKLLESAAVRPGVFSGVLSTVVQFCGLESTTVLHPEQTGLKRGLMELAKLS